jgi:hypothetical protein
MSTNVWYVVITLKNGEVYKGVSVELGPRVTGYGNCDTQGIWLQRYGCSTFIPGQDVESVKWVECRDDDSQASHGVIEPELAGVL